MLSTPRGSTRAVHSTATSFAYPVEARSESGESDDLLENIETVEERLEPRQPETGATFVRGVALLCACSLSIGSH
jgi:hypothetical protein